MNNLTLFDLDHTLLPLDSDYEWGQFMSRIGAVDPVEFARRNAEFYAQYQAGTLDLVRRHLDAGDLVAIITATNRFVTAPIAQEFGVEHLIAAEPEVDENGDITGAFIGTPPYGAGKVVNIRKWLAARGQSLEGFARSTFYSDSQNDIPLLEAVTHPVATNPNALLGAHAKERGWPILNLFND